MNEQFKWPATISTKKGRWVYVGFVEHKYDDHSYGLDMGNDDGLRVVYCGALQSVKIIAASDSGFEVIGVEGGRLVERCGSQGGKPRRYNNTPLIDSMKEILDVLPEPIKRCLRPAFDNRGNLKRLTADEIAESIGNTFLETFGLQYPTR